MMKPKLGFVDHLIQSFVRLIILAGTINKMAGLLLSKTTFACKTIKAVILATIIFPFAILRKNPGKIITQR